MNQLRTERHVDELLSSWWKNKHVNIKMRRKFQQSNDSNATKANIHLNLLRLSFLPCFLPLITSPPQKLHHFFFFLFEILFEVVLKPRWEKSSERLLAAPQHPRGHAAFCHPLKPSGNSARWISLESNSSLRKGDRRNRYGVHIPTPWHHRLYSNALCCSDNGWHRPNSEDFRENNWKFWLDVHSCESDVFKPSVRFEVE